MTETENPPAGRSLDVALVAQHVREHDGQGQVMLELGRELDRRGHSLTVYAHQVGDLGCRLVHVPSVPAVDLVDNVVFFAWATALLRRSAHDVAVVMGGCARPGNQWVYYAQFSQPGWRRTWTPATRPGMYHRLHARVAGLFESTGAKAAEALIACSAQVGADISPRAALHVVPNGVHVGRYRPATGTERSDARRRWNVPDGALVVGLLGEHRTGRKGLEPLLEAVAAGPDVEHLLIAGDGDHTRVASMAASLGIGERVHQLGFQPAQQVIAACDIVAVPSYYEPFSIVALEAAAMAVPVVISEVAGAAGHLRDSALIVERPDARLLREALDRAWADGPDGLRRRGLAARRAAENLDWKVTAAMAAEIVEKVATGSGQSCS